MCGRFALSPKTSDIEHLVPNVKNSHIVKSRYNIAPTQEVATILNEDSSEIVHAKWGLIPLWAKDPGIGNKMINARSETLTEKSSFRSLIKRKRCLILASGFYEWQKAGSQKMVPYYIHLKSGGVFAFAGLWDEWISPDKGKIISVTIITTEPNELMSKIHNRMPSILDSTNCLDWLDNSYTQEKHLKLLTQYPSELMEAYPVSSLVNNPGNDFIDCMNPA